MEHTVEIIIIITLNATFKSSAVLQCVTANTEILLSLDMTTYFHKHMVPPEG